MENARDDISISGRGSLAAGVYGNIHLSGSSKISGNVNCLSLHTSGALQAQGELVCENELKCGGSFRSTQTVRTKKLHCSGSCHVDADLHTEELHCSGSVRIGGSLYGGELETSGSTHVEGNVQAKFLRVSGSVKVHHDVKTDSAEIRGSFSVNGDCEAERFDSSGKVQIDGLLNAEEICMKLGRVDSEIGEIGGERIEVKSGSAISGGLFGFPLYKGSLVTNTIEGDEIFLEYTKAKIVRGSKVRIGTGCEIDMVEYKETLDVSNDAVVKKSTQSGSSESKHNSI